MATHEQAHPRRSVGHDGIYEVNVSLPDGTRAYWMGSRPTGAIIYSASGHAYFGRYEVSATGDAITHFVETSLRPNEVGVAYQRAIRIEGGRLFISLQAEEHGVSRHRVLTWRRAE